MNIESTTAVSYHITYRLSFCNATLEKPQTPYPDSIPDASDGSDGFLSISNKTVDEDEDAIEVNAEDGYIHPSVVSSSSTIEKSEPSEKNPSSIRFSPDPLLQGNYSDSKSIRSTPKIHQVPSEVNMDKNTGNALQVKDVVIWDDCPGRFSSWNPFTIISINGSTAMLDIVDYPVPLSELRLAD